MAKQISPLVERRHKPRLPRPVTSPGDLAFSPVGYEKFGSFSNPQTPMYEHRLAEPESPVQVPRTLNLDTQSMTNSPALSRRTDKPPPLQRFRSMSPTMCRRKLTEKLSPSSLRKSVILRSSRKSEPVYIDLCHACGFPFNDDNRISVSAKGGKRHLFHGECFKCSQ